MKVSTHVSSRVSRFAFFTALISTALILIGSPQRAKGQEPVPALPQVYIDTTWNPPTGTVWRVNANSTFQLALNMSVPGDTIILDNSVTYSGNFTLPAKSNPNHKWIYIESSGLANLPAPGTRVGPANASNMVKFTTPNVSAPFTLALGANHYRLVGMEITSNSSQGCNLQNNPPVNCFTYSLISPVSTSTPLVDSITVDRCYIHGSATQDVREGVIANGTNFAVVDSYISDIHQSTMDSQAILAYYTPGPIKIVDNFLSATTEDVMFGGAGDYNNPYVPSDIEIRNNHFYKPLSWDRQGITIPPFNQWVVKDNLELKSAQRVLVSGNTMENSWISGQMGYSVDLTVRTTQSGNIAVVDDITFESNLLTNVDAGWSMIESDDECSASFGYPNCTNPGESKRWKIYDNLLLMSPANDGSRHLAFSIGKGQTDAVIQHNTVLVSDGSTCYGSFYFNSDQSWSWPPAQSYTTNLWILDNALCQQPTGDNGGQGTTGLNYYMGNPAPLGTRFWGNAMFVPSGYGIATFPPHNYATAVPFIYQNPSMGDYILESPDWTDTTDGKVSGIDWASLLPTSVTTLTSGMSSLYPSQQTTLTATVSVSGSAGAPTGIVNFMLGSTMLGTGTLVAIDGTDSSATIQVRGTQLALGPNSITAVYAGDSNYEGSISPTLALTLLSCDEGFGTENVGVPSGAQALSYTFTAATQLTAINILTGGAPNLDFRDGGSSTCQVGVPYTAGQSCTVTVEFTPTAPGARAGAVTLFAQGSNLPLMTWYVSGIGQAPAVTIDPGTQTTLTTINGGSGYGSVMDGAGNLYVADKANGQVVRIAAGTMAQSVVASQLSSPTSVAMDGAGNLYIAESTGVVMVPNENGTLNASDLQTLTISGLGLAQGIAEDATGDLFIADSGNGVVLEVPGGSGAPQTIASGLTNPHSVAVDAAGNVYVSSDNQVSEYPAGGGTAVPLGSGYVTPQSVAVDASGTVYVADTGNAQIVKVVPGGQAQSVIAMTGLSAPRGVTLDATGNVYVSDGGNVYEVNRSQAWQLNFGEVAQGTTSPAQTLTLSNLGNEQLAASSLTISDQYQQQASGGQDCSGGTQLSAGGTCAIAVVFSPTTTGPVNGTVVLTDNALNNTSSQQSVAVTGTGGQPQQQPQTITFPNPGTQTYGGAPVTLTATASSGLPVTYTVTAGAATVSGNVLTITGAGTVTVQANQAGNEQWQAAPPVNDTFTVTPAVLTVTASDASMTYGGTLPAFAASYTGFVNGDGQGVLTGSPSLTTTATSSSPVGTYAITAAQGTLAAQNYTFTFVNGTLTINAAVLTVTANSASMTYGGTLPAFAASYTGFVNGDGQGVLTGSPSLTTTATSSSPVGTYAITAAQGTLSAQNYTFAFVDGLLTIVQAQSASGLTSTLTSLYSNQATTLTATVSVSGAGGAPTGTVSFMLGATVLGTSTLATVDGNDASATLQLQGTQLVSGPNSITAVYAGDNNYQGSTSPAITVTLLSSGLAFGDVTLGSSTPVQSLTYTFAGDTQLTAINILSGGSSNLDYQDGGSSTCQVGVPYTAGQSCTVTVEFTPTAPGARAGAVTLFAQGSNLPLMTWYVSGIGQAPAVTIDPGTQTTLTTINGGSGYGSVMDGAGNLYVADKANGQVVRIAAGTMAQSVVASQLSSPTSVAMDGAGNLYIAESTGVVMVPNENGTLNASDLQTLTISGLGLAQGIAEDATGDLFIADSGNGVVLEVPGGSGAPQTIASGLTNPHSVAVDAAGNVYVSSDNQVSEYPAGGGTAVPLGSGYVTPQSVTVDASGTVYVADTGNAQIVKVVPGGQAQSVIAMTGLSAPHGVTLDATGNVYVSDGGNVYEVNRSQAWQLNFGEVAQGTTSPAQTLTLSNLGNEQLAASSLTISDQYQQQASGGQDCSGGTQLSAGGTCAIAVVFSPTTTGPVNGTVVLTNNALNNASSQQSVAVTGTGGQPQQQPQTITFPNPGTQTYGGAPITLTATASSGLPVTYTVTAGAATVSGNVLTITGAGTVTVQANQAGNEQWQAAPPVNDTFTVTPAVLTVTASDASMTYGGTLPAFAASYTGFVNGDGQGVLTGSPSLTTTATSNSPVGTYAITAAQGTLAAQNYTFVFVTGTLTINAAVLTVTANSASMTYGGTLPAFAASYTGFVNGDGQGVLTGSPSLTTTATSSSPVGTYAITAAQGTLAAQNYTFVFVSGTLTINAAVLTVTANSASMTYGGTLPAFAASYTGFVNGDGQGVLTGSPSLTTTATSSSPVGTYAITAAQGTLSAQNYTFAFVNGTLTINPAMLVVTANNATRQYGQQNPAFTYTMTGFLNGDTQGTATSGQPSLTTSATTTSPLGNYAIVAGQGTLTAQNYTFAFVNAVLTITQAQTVISWTPATYTLRLGQMLGQAGVMDATVVPNNPGTMRYTSSVNGHIVALLPNMLLPVGQYRITCSFAPQDGTDYSTPMPVTVTISVTN